MNYETSVLEHPVEKLQITNFKSQISTKFKSINKTDLFGCWYWFI